MNRTDRPVAAIMCEVSWRDEPPAAGLAAFGWPLDDLLSWRPTTAVARATLHEPSD
jgi:hypothetical protein